MVQQKRNLIWIASYPKSGNTWFRAFISSLIGDSELDLNKMKANLIFSYRNTFDHFTDLDSSYLSDSEVKMILPEVYRFLSNNMTEPEYIKVHDAYTYNALNKPIIPADATHCAIYIIRNPLDIAGSFAAHMARPVDDTIRIMNKSSSALSIQKNNMNLVHQFRQLLLSWSEHVKSWESVTDFPILVLRYEDLLANPLDSFTEAVSFIGLEADEKRIRDAIEASSFSKLKSLELRIGFKEKDRRADIFFRSGTSGNWSKELTKEQAASIVSHHEAMMKQYGYDTDIDKYYP